MGRYRRYREEAEMQRNNTDIRYIDAYRKVKRIKGFYRHLAIYIIVNVIVIASHTNVHILGSKEVLRWEVLSMPLFWGIGLAAHGLSVFGRDIFFGKNWEERKIQQLMKKEEPNKWE